MSRDKFYCRDWTFQKLAHCLDQREASKLNGAILLGGAGCGKTALCLRLVEEKSTTRPLNSRLLAHFFVAENSSLTQFLRSLVAQIVANSVIGARFAEKLRQDRELQRALKRRSVEKDADECFKSAILFPLLEVEPPENSMFLLVDGVDGGVVNNNSGTLQRIGGMGAKSGRSSKTIGELLANHFHLLPQWLLLVVTARRRSKGGVARMFNGFRRISLDDLRKSHVVRDVQQYILMRLDEEAGLRQQIGRDTAEMLNQLHIKSNGCFLYLEKVLDAIADNFIALREIREIPGTLNGLYLFLCQRLFANRRQFAKITPIFNLILASDSSHSTTNQNSDSTHHLSAIQTNDNAENRDSAHLGNKTRPFILTKTKLYEILCKSKRRMGVAEFERRLKLIERLILIGQNDQSGRVAFFHASFSDWLQDVKHCTQKFLCNAQDGHWTFVLYYSREFLGDSRDFSGDSRDFYDFLYHLTRVTFKNLEIFAKNEEITNNFLVKLWLLENSGAWFEEIMGVVNNCEVEFDSFFEPMGVEDGRVLRLLEEMIGGVDCDEEEELEEDEDEDFGGGIHAAARIGKVEAVKKFLEAAAPAAADAQDADGWTALRAAAWGGHNEVVELLVSRGCVLDAVDADGRTALRAAAWSGHDDVVATLVLAGARVDAVDREGRTALIAAAYMGHVDVVERLLDAGADVDRADADGRTALGVAALCAPTRAGAVVAALLERGAEVDHVDKEGMTPLLVAAFEGHRDVCELLLENEADCDRADKNGRSPLWAAASMGHASTVALLLFWGCSIDTMDEEGRTVLSVASAQGCAEVVRLLLDRGLDEQHRDNSGWTPLHYAAYEGHGAVCHALLEAGARVDEVDNEGKAPLALAAQGGHALLCAELAHRWAAPVDQRGHDGKTALRLGALENRFDVAETLLGAGADIDGKDADGRSTLYVLALDAREKMARFFLERGADVETRDSEGRTPLHVSAWQGHAHIVRLLLKVGGADVDARDAENRTALHSASWQGHAECVATLLDAGASVDHACDQGATALGIAAQEGHEECVATLLAHGADALHSDACGRSAAKVAAKSGHRGVVRILEEWQLKRPPIGGGGAGAKQSDSVASIASTTETKPSNAVLYSLSPQQSGDSKSTNSSGRSSDKNNPITRNHSTNQRNEPQSPIYATPPLSPLIGCEQQRSFLLVGGGVAESHFTRDTHMRIILGQKGEESTNVVANQRKGGGGKRNGIVTNPALRLVQNLRKASGSGNGGGAAQKTNSFHWRKETPL